MSLRDILFGKKPNLSTEERLLKIIEKFIAASLLSPTANEGSENHQIIFLLYIFGAVDMICQSEELSTKETLSIFKSLLIKHGFSESEEDSDLLNSILNITGEPAGQELMREGGETLRLWLTGEDTTAPFRLTELFMDLDEE